MGKAKAPKKKCCKSRPRCKRCPVLLKLKGKKQKRLKAAA